VIKFGRVRVSAICLVVAALFAAINFSPHLPILLACIAVHEAGHILPVICGGGRINALHVMPFGVSISAGGRLTSYGQDMFAAFGGPLANIAASLVLLAVMRLITFNKYLLFAAVASAAYAAVNLFPVRGLDGGRMLELFLQSKLGEPRASIVFGIASAAALALLGLCSLLVLMATGYNFSLALMCGYLFYIIYFAPSSKRDLRR